MAVVERLERAPLVRGQVGHGGYLPAGQAASVSSLPWATRSLTVTIGGSSAYTGGVGVSPLVSNGRSLSSVTTAWLASSNQRDRSAIPA